jgi:homoserine/homoserine lactone efflux protein
MATVSIFAFIAVVVMVHVTPGPVMMTLALQTFNNGLKRGLLTYAGVEVAEIVLVAAVIFALQNATSSYLNIIRYLTMFSVAYLVYVAINSWRRDGPTGSTAARFSDNAFLGGIAVAVSDPATLLFYSALFPQFIDWHEAVGPQLLHLASTYLIIAFVFDAAVVFLSYRICARRNIRISKKTRGLLHAAGSSIIAVVVVVIVINNRIAERSTEIASAQPAKTGSVYTHTEAGMAVLVSN